MFLIKPGTDIKLKIIIIVIADNIYSPDILVKFKKNSTHILRQAHFQIFKVYSCNEVTCVTYVWITMRTEPKNIIKCQCRSAGITGNDKSHKSCTEY